MGEGYFRISEMYWNQSGTCAELWNMGICYAQLGEKLKALAAFDEALEIDPKYEPAIVNKAHVEGMRDGEP